LGYKIIVSHDLSDFEQLEVEWDTLVSQSDAWGAALSWTWMNVWLKHFHNTGELWLLTARDEESDELVGIAPLFKRRNKPKYGFTYTQIEFIGSSHHHENLEFVIREGEKEKLIPEFITTLMTYKEEWDVLLLSGIADAETCQIIQASGLGCERNRRREMLSPKIPLPATSDEWFSSLSKNRRKKLRSYPKRMNVEFPGEWEIRTIRDAEELDPVFNKLVRYHQGRWEKTGKEGAFHYGEWAEYYRDLMWAMFDKGWLRLNALFINDEPVVILFSFYYRGRAFDYIAGSLPMETRIPLGYMLTRFSIENAISESMKEYCFMWGGEEYKYSFGAENQTLSALEIISTPWVRSMRKGIKFLRSRKRLLYNIMNQQAEQPAR